MIEITKMTFTHDGGTKNYDIFLVKCPETSMGAVIRRWGKIGSFGQVKCDVFTDTAAQRDFVTQTKKRAARGYNETESRAYSFATADEVADYLGPVWSKCSGDLMNVMGDISGDPHTPAFKEPSPPEPEKEIVRPATWGSW